MAPDLTKQLTQLNDTHHHPFQPIPIDNTPLSLYRRPDVTDTFSTHKYRTHPHCNISSLSLHNAFSPLCTSRTSFLRAFSSGGRIGFDTPYMPLSCDMRWFTTAETCAILSRFHKVIFVGDSMMRHVVGAMNVVLRQDLGYGAVTGWNFGQEEMEQCFCTHQMDVKACSVQGIYSTQDVLVHDPESFACAKRTIKNKDGRVEVVSDVDLEIEVMLKYPLDPSELERLKALFPEQKPERPVAFVFGHGLWNDLDIQATVNWIRGVLDAIYEKAEYLRPENLPVETVEGEGDLPMAHVLFMTPSAAGVLKDDRFILTQGDKALQVFESSLHTLIHRRDEMFHGKGMEHMGTWNMSIQMDKWDGVHLNLRGNLLKAMGVINWLSGIKAENWS